MLRIYMVLIGISFIDSFRSLSFGAGMNSFEHLRFRDDELCRTFRKAARRLGIIDDDN